MKKIILIFAILIPTLCIAQTNFDDRITINQVNNKYTGLDVGAYQGLHVGGHPFLSMQNIGGTKTNPLPTPSNRLLGTIIYSGYDGENNIQAGRITVISSGVFSTGNHPVKMNFKLGGTAECCGITRMTIDGQTGNIGIGTTNTNNYKLAVNGKIKAKEVKVETTGWSDFVFKEKYNLPTLAEVEKHIKEKGHLKDIPSAKEVAKNGIYLGQINAKLLQKIEELTLYTIQQQKEIESLRLLAKRLTKIEEQLKVKTANNNK